MRTLSIFIDESGDFGEYDFHSPYYIVSMVFHNQSNSISNEVNKFNDVLNKMGFIDHCVHSAPIIRGEEEYRQYDITTRKTLIRKTASFVRHLNIEYKDFCVEKKHIQDDVEIAGKLSKEISNFLKNEITYFQSFNRIIVYYDNGQIQLNKILISIFNALFDNVTFRKVNPADYRLFQVADFMCTMKMISLKYKNKITSKSESYFFEDEKTFNKQYSKYLIKKEKK